MLFGPFLTFFCSAYRTYIPYDFETGYYKGGFGDETPMFRSSIDRNVYDFMAKQLEFIFVCLALSDHAHLTSERSSRGEQPRRLSIVEPLLLLRHCSAS